MVTILSDIFEMPSLLHCFFWCLETLENGKNSKFHFKWYYCQTCQGLPKFANYDERSIYFIWWLNDNKICLVKNSEVLIKWSIAYIIYTSEIYQTYNVFLQKWNISNSVWPTHSLKKNRLSTNLFSIFVIKLYRNSISQKHLVKSLKNKVTQLNKNHSQSAVFSLKFFNFLFYTIFNTIRPIKLQIISLCNVKKI